MSNTVAQVFADYLGMNPSNAGWAWKIDTCVCDGSGLNQSGGTCRSCDGYGVDPPTLTATSPLAPEPTPGWLEALVKHKRFGELCCGGDDYFAAMYNDDLRQRTANATHPTHAVARALVAADTALRARLEACADWKDSQ